MLASVIANVNRDPKARPEPYTPRDFMPRRAGEVKDPFAPQTSEENLTKVRAFFGSAIGGG